MQVDIIWCDKTVLFLFSMNPKGRAGAEVWYDIAPGSIESLRYHTCARAHGKSS